MASRASNILQGAREALSIAKGEASPATFKVHVPADVDVRAIRAKSGLTQAEFAAAYGFPAGTLRDWEQGRVVPDTAARMLLSVIEHRPDAVRETLGILRARAEANREGADLIEKHSPANPGLGGLARQLHENADQAEADIRQIEAEMSINAAE